MKYTFSNPPKSKNNLEITEYIETGEHSVAYGAKYVLVPGQKIRLEFTEKRSFLIKKALLSITNQGNINVD